MTKKHDVTTPEPGGKDVQGNEGKDILVGGSKRDFFDGGGGSDWIYGEEGSDVIQGSGGDDWIWGGAGDDYIWGGAGGDRIWGGDGHDWIWGQGTGENRIEGGEGDDHLWGGKGVDFIWGGIGDDGLAGDDGDDHLWGGAGKDTIEGMDGDDHLYGGANDDHLYGGAGNDTMDGGANDDHLYGGAGNDTMEGGDGNDRFHFRVGDGIDNGHDTITDFGRGDTIVFHAGAGAGVDVGMYRYGDDTVLEYANGRIKLAGVLPDSVDKSAFEGIANLVSVKVRKVDISKIEESVTIEDFTNGRTKIEIVDPNGGTETVLTNVEISANGENTVVEVNNKKFTLVGVSLENINKDDFLGVDSVTRKIDIKTPSSVTGVSTDEKIKLVVKGDDGTETVVTDVTISTNNEGDTSITANEGTVTLTGISPEAIGRANLEGVTSVTRKIDATKPATVSGFEKGDLISFKGLDKEDSVTVSQDGGNTVIDNGKITIILRDFSAEDLARDDSDANAPSFVRKITAGNGDHTVSDYRKGDKFDFGNDSASVEISQSNEGARITYNNLTVTVTGVDMRQLIADGCFGEGVDITCHITGSDSDDPDLSGGEHTDIIKGFGGDDTLRGFGGDDLLFGGRGTDSLRGGAGDDTFQFSEGDGQDTVHDFGTGDDIIELILGKPPGTSDEAAFESLDIRQNGADTVVGYGDGSDTVTLKGVDKDTVDIDDFDFLFAG